MYLGISAHLAKCGWTYGGTNPIPLSAFKVKSLTKAGRYTDSHGLALVVKPNGARSWVLRYQKQGKRRELSLGSARNVPLAMARERASEARLQIESGIDPALERKKARGVPTFSEAAALLHAEKMPTFKTKKAGLNWINILKTYAIPKIGNMPVDAIQPPDIRSILLPIWQDKNDTAKKARQRTVAVLDWAVASGFREQPIDMRVVNSTLPKPTKAGHFAAMPFPAVPKFMESLAEKDTMGAMALRFTILTAVRSGETRLATWQEIDFKARLWTIPDERMKAGEKHVVPLSGLALDVLEAVKNERPDACIFPNRSGLPLSDMTLSKVLRDAGQPFTVHGFRSSFRDWTAEQTDFPREIAEAALAHKNPNKVEAAYLRTNYLEKRRELMDSWASHCMN